MKKSDILYFGIIILLFLLLKPETGLAQSQTETFEFTGSQQSFVVPPGVNSIHIEAWGAEGATVVPDAPAGLGGFAEGDLNVTPGQTLEIFVGGQGCVQTVSTLGCGGFNGGGDAGGIEPGRGGGGGASDVRISPATLNDRAIVAAGGGGGCESSDYPGGDGGGLLGNQGGVEQPGGGGTQIAGGFGFSDPACLGGGFGFGGSSAEGNTCAGGGGGLYGGGSGCGGGGGSSYIGGVLGGNTESGVREGDGLVTITYEFVARVPTLSEWGLMAMAAILGIAGATVMKRRRVAA